MQEETYGLSQAGFRRMASLTSVMALSAWPRRRKALERLLYSVAFLLSSWIASEYLRLKS